MFTAYVCIIYVNGYEDGYPAQVLFKILSLPIDPVLGPIIHTTAFFWRKK